MRRMAGAVLLALAAAGAAAAQSVELGGEVRPRIEWRDPVNGGEGAGSHTLDMTSMRTRVSALAELRGGARAFVQLQDVRLWGGEASTTDGSADALDLHQGWVELGSPEASTWTARAGRQELAYGDERLVGALNWAQQARSFDGLRLRYRGTGVVVDGLAMSLGEREAGTGDAALYGVYGRLGESGSVQAYVLYNSADALRADPAREVDVTDQYTLGGRWAAARGRWDWRVEGAYQLGERSMEDVSAYLFAAKAGAAVTQAWRVGVLYDRLSGDDDPADGTVRVFDTLFATNHKFYGYMDLFLNIPVQTAGRGLQDVGVESGYVVTPDLSLGLNGHTFALAAASGVGSAHLGEEIDLTARWSYAPGVVLTGGASYFAAGAAWTDVLGHAEDHQGWLYVMLDVAF